MDSIAVVLTPSIQPEPIALATGVDLADRDTVEAQGLAARPANPDQRRRLIVEGEAVRRLEGEAEFWMNEGVAAHDALRRVVAEGEAVYRPEIAGAIDLAASGRPELPRFLGRVGNALGRRRMRRHHVRAVGRSTARDRSAKRAPFAERGEEAGRRVRVVSCPGDGLDADLVGLEFLLAGEAGDRQLRARLDFVLGLALGEHLRVHLGEQCGRLLELRPLGGVAGGDMADLVRHDGGDFGRVVGESQKAAGDEDIAGRKGEGVDDGRIEDGDLVGLSSGVRGRSELDQYPVEISFGRRRAIDAAERVDEALALWTDWNAGDGRGTVGGATLTGAGGGSIAAQAASLNASAAVSAVSRRCPRRGAASLPDCPAGRSSIRLRFS